MRREDDVVDAVTAAFVGGFAGAGISGIVAIALAVVNNRTQREEARSQRKHEMDLRDKERAHELTMEDREARRAQITQWRRGLAASYEATERFLQGLKNEPEGSLAFINPDEPNIVGTEWFESLRLYLDPADSRTEHYRNAVGILQCSYDAVRLLGTEINRIQSEWFDTAPLKGT